MTICPFKLRCTELLQNGNGNSLSAGQRKSTSHWHSNQKGAEKIIEKNKTKTKLHYDLPLPCKANENIVKVFAVKRANLSRGVPFF